MRQNKNNVKMWRKITGLLLSAWMLVSCVPGTVYGAEGAVNDEVSVNDDISMSHDISAENASVNGEAETEVSASVHQHVWKYEVRGTNAVTVSCQGKTGTCSVGSNGVHLTLDVQKESEYTNAPGKSRAAVVAGNSQLDLNGLGIVYQLTYYRDADGQASGTAMSTEPRNVGVYNVKAAFGSGNNTVLENTFTIKRAERSSSNAVKMDSYEYGSSEAAGPSLKNSVQTETIEYWYYRKDEENPCKIQDGSESFDPAGLETGTYDVLAKYTRSGYGNYIYATGKTRFQVEAVHQHEWKYEKQGENAVTVSCQGKTGNCSVGAAGIRLTLEVEKESVYTSSAGKSRIAVAADNSQLDLSGLGIVYRLTYYKDTDGQASGTAMSTEPRNAGVYHVKAAFGSGNNTVLEDTFTIKRAEGTSSFKVKMDSYKYGSSEAAGPSLERTAETIEYWYYQENEESPCKIQNGTESFDPAGLEAGTYDVLAKYTRSGRENYIYVTEKTRFQVEKGNRWGIGVRIQSYDMKGRTPSPELTEKLEDDAEIVYYYSRQNKNIAGIEWSGGKLSAGTYYMYAVIGETSDYFEYTTPIQKFTVHADHKWSGMPKELASKAQTKRVRCSHCGKTQTVRLPKKTVNVMMGKTVKINSKGCTFTLKKSARVKKQCFSLSKTGKINTKNRPACYKSMGTSVPVAVKVCGKSYSMNVKLKIPRPKVTVKYKRVQKNGRLGYLFEFHYRIPGASRMKVQMEGESEGIKKNLAKINDPRPKKVPKLALSDNFLRTLNNTVTFKFRAYYGKNKSEILRVTKTVGAGGGGSSGGAVAFF